MKELLMKNIKNDITAINPINTVCKFIGILPNINMNDFNDFKTLKFLPITFTIVFFSIFVVSTIGKITSLYNYVGITVQITDLSVDISLILINIAWFIGLNLYKGKNIHRFLANLRKLDEEFKGVKSDSKYPNSKFCIEFTAVHVFYFIHFIMNISLWFNLLDFFVYQHFLLRDIQHYFVIIQVMLMRYYALLINYRYEILNKIFSNINVTGCIVMAVNEDLVYKQWCIRKVNKIFVNLGEIVDEYNRIFGWQYFLMYIHVLVILLLPINMCFVYGDGINHIKGVHFGMQFIILCTIWSILSIVMSLAIFAGGCSVAEAQRTSIIAYTWLRELPNNEKFHYVRNELLDLAHLASSRCPEITAAGFFTVNYKTLFSLYGSVASYLVVLLQYNK